MLNHLFKSDKSESLPMLLECMYTVSLATEDVLQVFTFMILLKKGGLNIYFHCDVVVMTKMNCTGQEWQR